MSSEISLSFLSKKQDGFCLQLEKVVGTKTHLATINLPIKVKVW